MISLYCLRIVRLPPGVVILLGGQIGSAQVTLIIVGLMTNFLNVRGSVLTGRTQKYSLVSALPSGGGFPRAAKERCVVVSWVCKM